MINQAVIFQSSLITHSKREPDSALEIEDGNVPEEWHPTSIEFTTINSKNSLKSIVTCTQHPKCMCNLKLWSPQDLLLKQSMMG